MSNLKTVKNAMYFHYMPVGNDASLELLPTPEQRMYIKDRIREIRKLENGEGLFTMDFQNDGEFVGGCIAGGRNYFHINANGDAGRVLSSIDKREGCFYISTFSS